MRTSLCSTRVSVITVLPAVITFLWLGYHGWAYHLHTVLSKGGLELEYLIRHVVIQQTKVGGRYLLCYTSVDGRGVFYHYLGTYTALRMLS